MTYAELETMQRQAKILFEPAGWRLPYQQLHDQTDVSGWEMFLLESYDNFNNPFAQAMQELWQELYKQNKQNFWFGLILRDVVRESERGTDDKGKLHLTYISHAGTEWEQTHDVKAPKDGYYVPNDDCETINGVVIPFQLGTIVPFETLPFNKTREAKRRLEAKGIPKEQLSGFHRLDSYKDDPRFAVHYFSPPFAGSGRFGVGLDTLPSSFGRFASLPAYREHEKVIQEPVMRVNARQEEHPHKK